MAREAARALEAATAIAASAAAARSDVAALDLAGGDAPYWLPPGRRDRVWLVADRLGEDTPFDAPDDNLEQAFALLAGMRSDLPPGTFVFVLSDFLVSPPAVSWVEALAHGWDVVPVVVRDPVWEQSFPPVGGVGVPVMDPGSGRVSLVRLTAREAERRRAANEERQRLCWRSSQRSDSIPSCSARVSPTRSTASSSLGPSCGSSGGGRDEVGRLDCARRRRGSRRGGAPARARNAAARRRSRCAR